MKPTLLLLHGALGTEHQFAKLKVPLSASYDVHTLNFEGHGSTSCKKDFSIQLFAQNVFDYITRHSLNDVTIFGYSMGGYVALQVALIIPNKIIKIITLATKFHWTVQSAAGEVRFLDPLKIEEKVPHFAEKLKHAHHPQDWKVVMNKTAHMMLSMGNGAKLNDDQFKAITQPVTIYIGSLDQMVSIEESQQISALLPNSKVIILEGAKHPIDTIDTNQLMLLFD